MPVDPNQLLTTSHAGRMLELSADGVRYQERVGKLTAIKTGTGMRLFRRGDVEALALKRSQAQHQKLGRKRKQSVGIKMAQ